MDHFEICFTIVLSLNFVEFEWANSALSGGVGGTNMARTSHEQRQTLMYLLDASVRRRMSKKVQQVCELLSSKFIVLNILINVSYAYINICHNE